MPLTIPRMGPRGWAFIALALLALTPSVTGPVALLAGALFALSWGNPFPAQSKHLQTWLLQVAVVGLGATMNLEVVLRVGASGMGQTLLGLTLTLGLALGLSRALKTEPTTSLLIGVGTAICGGSAIAAVGPAIGAKPHQTSMALAVVFMLNAAALFIFPAVGHAMQLTPQQFGLWSALAIHDTSSVVGAALSFDEAALPVATTVKLARALWIFPLTIALGHWWKREQLGPRSAAKRPWFILGFVVVAALVTWVPSLHEVGRWVSALARQLLVATLFLVGAGISREAIRQVGARAIALGLLLWLCVAAATLGAVHSGWLALPSL